jgi:hypothetical protein
MELRPPNEHRLRMDAADHVKVVKQRDEYKRRLDQMFSMALEADAKVAALRVELVTARKQLKLSEKQRAKQNRAEAGEYKMEDAVGMQHVAAHLMHYNDGRKCVFLAPPEGGVCQVYVEPKSAN